MQIIAPFGNVAIAFTFRKLIDFAFGVKQMEWIEAI